jgi:hypothetical protein
MILCMGSLQNTEEKGHQKYYVKLIGPLHMLNLFW